MLVLGIQKLIYMPLAGLLVLTFWFDIWVRYDSCVTVLICFPMPSIYYALINCSFMKFLNFGLINRFSLELFSACCSYSCSTAILIVALTRQYVS